MKALYFDRHGDADVLRFGDLPDPLPARGWVRVRVRACSLNHIDVLARRGLPGIAIPLPHVGGLDAAGEIEALGEDVEGWRVGDRVLVYPPHLDYANGKVEIMGETRDGALAEYCICRASQLHRIPDHVSFDAAACLPAAYGTAHRMLHTRGALQPGQTVLVLGASGGVGNAAVLLAKRLGCHVTAAAGGADKCARLLEMGADAVVDYRAESIVDYTRRTTGSFLRGGFDVVVNFTGGDTWVPSIKCVRRHGRLLTCGATAGYDPKTDIRYIFMGEISIVGSTGWEPEDQQAVLDMLADGSLRPPVARTLPLSEGRAALEALESRDFFGKIVIHP